MIPKYQKRSACGAPATIVRLEIVLFVLILTLIVVHILVLVLILILILVAVLGTVGTIIVLVLVIIIIRHVESLLIYFLLQEYYAFFAFFYPEFI